MSSEWFHSKLTPIFHPSSSSCPPPHDTILCASSLRRIWPGSLAASLLYLHIKELWLPPLCFKVFSFQDIWKSLILWPPTFVIFFFDHKCIWDFSSCRTKIYLFSWPSNSHKYFLEDGSPRVGFMSTEAWLNYPGRGALMEKKEKVRTEERLSLRRASWF